MERLSRFRSRCVARFRRPNSARVWWDPPVCDTEDSALSFNTLRVVKDLVAQFGDREEESTAITDKKLLRRFIDNADFPFLVSFPRTGSHWLRMIMELYFERPSLARVFYYPKRKDYLTLHTHDMDLDLYRRNVIYLYRNPIPTVYSQMRYENEDRTDVERIRYWSDRYGDHLTKWLTDEDVSERKTIIHYEHLQNDLTEEFSKVTAHFGQTLDIDRLTRATARVSKEEVNRKTTHDPQVVNLKREYASGREAFATRFAGLISERIIGLHPGLAKWLEPL